jgi:glycosyltransferase involved in cell wall biosynthesis
VISTIEPEVGGPSHSAVNMAIAERWAGTATTLVFTAGRHAADSLAPARERLAEHGVAVRTFRRPRVAAALVKRWGISVRFALWIVGRARRYDIVHVHYVWSLGTLVGILAGVLWHKPVVLTPHESLTNFDADTSRSALRRRQKLLLRRLLLRGVDRVVLASELELRDSLEHRRQGSVIPHPVAVPPHVARRTASDASGVTFGYLGRLHPKKRVGVLLDAFATLTGPARLVIGGNQPLDELDRLRIRAADLGIADRVHFVGFVEPAKRGAFFDRLDCLVMPSSYECFGMVAAEAMSSGLPVIVSDTTGVATVVAAHGAGIVVPVGDASALEQELAVLAEEPSRLVAMGLAGHAAAAATFSFEAYGLNITSLYRELLESRERRPSTVPPRA